MLRLFQKFTILCEGNLVTLLHITGVDDVCLNVSAISLSNLTV